MTKAEITKSVMTHLEQKFGKQIFQDKNFQALVKNIVSKNYKRMPL